MNNKIRVCDNCGVLFVKRAGNQRFCTKDCCDNWYFEERQKKYKESGYPQCLRCGIFYSPYKDEYERQYRFYLNYHGNMRSYNFQYCIKCLSIFDNLFTLLKAYVPCGRCNKKIINIFEKRDTPPNTIIDNVLPTCERDCKLYDLLPTPNEVIKNHHHSIYRNQIEMRVHLLAPHLLYNSERLYKVDLSNGHTKYPDFVVNHFLESKKVIEIHGDFWHKKADLYYDFKWRDTVNDKLLQDLYAEKGFECLVVWEKEIWNNPIETKLELIDFIGES